MVTIYLDYIYLKSLPFVQDMACSASGWKLNLRRYQADNDSLDDMVFGPLKLSTDDYRDLCNQRLQANIRHVAQSARFTRNCSKAAQSTLIKSVSHKFVESLKHNKTGKLRFVNS